MKAMILAAGSGTRMQHLTESTPKPLLRVCGETLIGHQIQHLSQAGFTDVVINVSYLADQIIAALGDGSQYGVSIHYSYEPEVGGLETGGGIFQALPLLGREPFLVTSADIYTNYPYAELRGRDIDAAHLVLVPNPDYHPEGDFGLTDDALVTVQPPKYNYAGIGVVSSALFDGVTASKFSLSSRLMPAIAEQRVHGELYTGDWFNVGTPSQLEALTQHLTSATGR